MITVRFEQTWPKIKSFIFEAISLYVPKVRKRTHQGPKWFDSGIRHHLKCLHILHRKYNSHPTPLILSKLKSSEHQLQLKMVSSKSEYEAKLITHFRSDNSSKIYKYICSVTGQNSIPNSVYLDSATADFDLEKSSLFNSFFPLRLH